MNTLVVNLKICFDRKMEISISNVDLISKQGIDTLKTIESIIEPMRDEISDTEPKIYLKTVESDLPVEVVTYIDNSCVEGEEEIEEFVKLFDYIESNFPPKIDLGSFIALTTNFPDFKIIDISTIIRNEFYYFLNEDKAKNLENLGIEIAQNTDLYYDLEDKSALKYFDFQKYGKDRMETYIHVPSFGYYIFWSLDKDW